MLITYIVAVLLVLLVILAEIYLSGKKSKMLGLILPIITLAFSFVFSFLVVTNINVPVGTDPLSIIIKTIITAFLTSNIPTALLLIIYLVCRKKDRDATK